MKYRKAMELVRALKSGRYKQTTGVLKSKDGYCCLGVGCRVAGKRFKLVGTEYHCEENWLLMPLSVMQYFGFDSNDGSPTDCESLVIDGREFSCLSNANDEGVSFDKIAATIKENWRRL